MPKKSEKLNSSTVSLRGKDRQQKGYICRIASRQRTKNLRYTLDTLKVIQEVSPFHLSNPLFGMENKLSLDYNVEGRIERAPLGVISYILNIIGIIGNAVVIHIFRTRTGPSSNYRIFVLFLSFVDVFLCVAHIPKELSRMIFVYDQQLIPELSDVVCKVSHYLGNSVGMASLLIVFFISFERYRKICTPFKSQISLTRSKIMCVSVIITGFVVQFPIFLIHGTRYVQVENINATRCNIENKYDGNFLTFLFYVFIFVAAFICIILIIILQVKIRHALVKKAQTKRQMKSKAKALVYKIPDENVVQKEKANQTDPKESAIDQEAEKNRRIAITFAVVTVFLLSSFVTITLFQSIQVTNRYFYPRQKISKMEDILEEYLPDTVSFNGILNPFVYFFTDVQFKLEVMKLCGRK